MNYKIAKTMLVLCVVYLIGFYVLKFIFPELLLLSITSPIMIRLGEFFSNSWVGFSHILKVLTSLWTYCIFVCASTGRFKRTRFEMVSIIIAVAIGKVVIELFPELYTHTSISIMLSLALLCKGRLSYTVVSFVLHGYLSQFLLSIRGVETVIVLIAKTGVVGSLVMGIEMYVWLILLSLLFYFKEKKNGRNLSSVPQQTQQTVGETISESGKERSES